MSFDSRSPSRRDEATGAAINAALPRILGLEPAPCRLVTSEPEPPAILAAKEGDLIEVIQPDGERETYRLASAEPTADGFGVTFQMEPVP